MQSARLIERIELDFAKFEDAVFADAHRMLDQFTTSLANRNVYWLALYGDAVSAELILHVFTEHDWQRVRRSPSYVSWSDARVVAPFDGPRWSPGDCSIFLDEWSDETRDMCSRMRANPLATLLGSAPDEDEELELWDEFDEVLVRVVSRLDDSLARSRLNVTPAFFASTCGHDESADEAARRARRNVHPRRFAVLFPNECSLPDWIDVPDSSPSEELHSLLELAHRLAVDPAVSQRWYQHSPILTGLEDALVELGRRWPPTLAAIEWSDMAAGRNWQVASAMLSASTRLRNTDDPVLNGW